ncbi:glucokinase [Sphingomonas desiccabilis]|uniref:Glucokinase n=1 Tax=Sphingomonas desiccabilis TaxID=429134 RepID=A0A4Q2IXK5_9SPHN|nr:glucokinase [Sphingomonas desiccabilis]MBB3910598.1 glucokinase [Sphingomonas desiccabilis]RXZ35226.1 glucokinase [Sphingomonas desiccabilis]
MEVVAVDIGGTHARFAIAEVEGGRVVHLGEPVTQKVAEHATFPLAWAAFAEQLDRPVPRAAAIALASPINPELIKLTNNPWIIRPPLIKDRLDVDRYTLINDFGAIGHAVGQLDGGAYVHLCGPDVPLPEQGSLTVCGPGTGLGVAQVYRSNGEYHVIATEGGHQDYAPLDEIDDAIIRRLRPTYTRVSAERVCAGPGLVHIYETLAQIEGKPYVHLDDKKLWQLAFEGGDKLAVAALDRFCVSLGGVAGDLALAHGPTGVVIAGGLGLRLKDRLIESGFAQRFVAKGRFQQLMNTIPVKIITHPQPGLFGAAAAFAQEHAR